MSALPPTRPSLASTISTNYAFPLATHLDRAGVVFASVWATKAHTARLLVRADTATPAQPAVTGAVRTSASASTTAYKQQIHDQTRGLDELVDGPVTLQLAFAVGARRNWINLWKPTIDALDALLGRTRPDRDWHPRDGRITELGLDRTLDRSLGNDVVIAVAAAPEPSSSPPAAH
jgi:hypothetical protein